jgi:glycosyltransferase involved in cell wall biosynthesis
MSAGPVAVSVVTPSRNQLAFLRNCCASVADQQGGEVEHIVVDGASHDGTREWLLRQPGLRWLSEPDGGLYEAVNKGLRLSRGEILAVLNCDEQYLPGAVAEVTRFFRQRPEADILFGDFLALAPDGELLAFRKAIPLRWPYVVSSYLYAGTCALFFRRRLLERGLWFRDDLRYVGDADFVVRALRRGFRAQLLRRYLSVFIDHGSNLSGSRQAAAERRAWTRTFPAPVRWLAPALDLARLAEKAARGCYRQALPLEYEVFTAGSGGRRRKFVQPAAGFRWQVGATTGRR